MLLSKRIYVYKCFRFRIDKSRHKSVSALISHELSHVWFGNLVTMSEWSDIWLNEGFANHLEHFAVHDLYPELKMDVEHQKVDVQAAFERDDNLVKSRPIVNKADTPDEVRLFYPEPFQHAITFSCHGRSSFYSMTSLMASQEP